MLFVRYVYYSLLFGQLDYLFIRWSACELAVLAKGTCTLDNSIYRLAQSTQRPMVLFVRPYSFIDWLAFEQICWIVKSRNNPHLHAIVHAFSLVLKHEYTLTLSRYLVHSLIRPRSFPDAPLPSHSYTQLFFHTSIQLSVFTPPPPLVPSAVC